MIIGIDGNEANVERRVGIGEYSFELLKKFKEFKIQNLKFKIYLKESPLSNMPKEREGWQYRIFGPKKMWTQFGLPLHLFFGKSRPDVFFTPSHYAPRFSPIPTTISVMDLSYIHFPELFNKDDLYQLKNWTAYSVRNAKRVFTISQASKNDIIKEYKVPEEKVIVTYPGIKEVKSEKLKVKNLKMNDLIKKYEIQGQYILFVGTLQPRKNIERLIEAFAKISNLKSQISNMDLIIVGKKGWKYEEILSAPDKFGVKEKVKFLDFVSEEELAALYKNAVCFVLPSLYEGFGLPVLEAMQYGCPVITSNISSLPEAGGDAAIYFNPEDVNDITEKIKLVVLDEKLRSKMKEKGLEQVKKFSWEKTASETLEALLALQSSK